MVCSGSSIIRIDTLYLVYSVKEFDVRSLTFLFKISLAMVENVVTIIITSPHTETHVFPDSVFLEANCSSLNQKLI